MVGELKYEEAGDIISILHVYKEIGAFTEEVEDLYSSVKAVLNHQKKL